MSTLPNDSTSKVVNARVVCRIRPQNQNEKKSGGLSCIEHSNKGIEVYTSLGQYPFDCDHIFDENASQSDLFNYCARPHVEDALAGINSTILAFGQTGSGKTYSIEGDINDPDRIGIVPRTLLALFNAAIERIETAEFGFKISFIEIYMEKIKDLLIEEKTASPQKQNTVKIVGVEVTEKSIFTYEQFMKYWKAGKRCNCWKYSSFKYVLFL